MDPRIAPRLLRDPGECGKASIELGLVGADHRQHMAVPVGEDEGVSPPYPLGPLQLKPAAPGDDDCHEQAEGFHASWILHEDAEVFVVEDRDR